MTTMETMLIMLIATITIITVVGYHANCWFVFPLQHSALAICVSDLNKLQLNVDRESP